MAIVWPHKACNSLVFCVHLPCVVLEGIGRVFAIYLRVELLVNDAVDDGEDEVSTEQYKEH